MAKVKPISPKEVIEKKIETFPDEMIETVNKLIAEHWDGYSSTIKQDKIKEEFLKLYNSKNTPKITAAQMFKNHWMDFEDIFRKAGWKVEYDKPGYNESYDAYFVFKK